jgi:hypothetical protein
MLLEIPDGGYVSGFLFRCRRQWGGAVMELLGPQWPEPC